MVILGLAVIDEATTCKQIVGAGSDAQEVVLYYEDQWLFPENLDINDPLSTYYVDEPIGPETNSTGSIQYTSDGLVVVGAENAAHGRLAIITDQNQKVLGFAFGDDDDNWSDEFSAIGNGLGCIGGVGATVYTSGAASIFTGIATAGACISFVGSLGTLSSSYASTPTYTQSVTVNLTSGITTYTYDYDGAGAWSIDWDPTTEEWSDWEWIESVIQDA